MNRELPKLPTLTASIFKSAAVLAGMTALTAEAAVKTWTNGAAAANRLKWINPNNWDSTPQPTTSDTTVFTSSVLIQNTVVTIGNNATTTGKAGQIQFDGAPTFTVGASTDPYGLSLAGLPDGSGGFLGLVRTATAATDPTSTNVQTLFSPVTLGNTVAFQIADQSGPGGPGGVVVTGAIGDDVNTYGLTKTGAGRLQLAGANTYKGPTAVSAGTLLVNGSNAGGGAFTVGDGTNAATLGGTGAIAGGVTVADKATLAPGVAAGTLTVGSLALANASVLSFDLNQPGSAIPALGNDLVTVNGNLVLDGVLNVNAGANFTAGTYALFAYSGALTNNALAIAALPNGLSGSVDASSPGVVNLVVTPEPATLGLLATGALVGLRRCRHPSV